jgi:16S rRNA (guanine527-N7)-methyltransferase
VQIERFHIYLQLLMTWNQRLNLTAVRDPVAIQDRHFLDSLTCMPATGNLSHKKIIDVGSGAGFPGLPLKILFPDLCLTLVESVGKKAAFLEAVVQELGLSQVQILAARVEELGQAADHREQYDWAMARAVARLNILVEYLLPLVHIGGYALAQKGAQAAAEADEAQAGIARLGGAPPRLRRVSLPEQEAPSFLIIIEKISPTPEKYPRRVGIPAKRPL